MDQYTVLAPFYDRLNKETDYRGILAFTKTVLQQHGLSQDAMLLDLACGTGKLTNLFAKEGYDMIGADLSPDMLAEAQSAAAEEGVFPLYLCQDMRALDLYGTVDAAYCYLDSLNYLSSEADLSAVFSRLYHFIAPNGIFIFDVNTAYRFREVYGQNTFVYDEDDLFCVWQNFFDEKTGFCDFDLTFFVKDGKKGYRRMEESQRERLFTREAILKAIGDNGFTLEAVYGGLDFTSPTDTSEKHYYVVKRGFSL